jgi:hypothetical protein
MSGDEGAGAALRREGLAVPLFSAIHVEGQEALLMGLRVMVDSNSQQTELQLNFVSLLLSRWPHTLNSSEHSSLGRPPVCYKLSQQAKAHCGP